eukprot:scaffold82586_cov19-Prasinocladus_malaysianus.AAC.2
MLRRLSLLWPCPAVSRLYSAQPYGPGGSAARNPEANTDKSNKAEGYAELVDNGRRLNIFGKATEVSHLFTMQTHSMCLGSNINPDTFKVSLRRLSESQLLNFPAGDNLTPYVARDKVTQRDYYTSYVGSLANRQHIELAG